MIMLAGRYTMLEQGALDDLLPTCERRGVSVVAVGVFNSGVLSRVEPESGAKYNYADAPDEVVRRARRIARICTGYGVSLPAAAVQLPLAHPAVASVGIGCRSVEQVRRNVALLDVEIPTEMWADLMESGLLRRDCPVPGGRAPGGV